MKKFVCIACANEYNTLREAEECCGEEAEEIDEEDEGTEETELID